MADLLPADEKEDEENQYISASHSPIPLKHAVSRKVRKSNASMFLDFAKHHNAMIERMIKENEKRVALEAQ